MDREEVWGATGIRAENLAMRPGEFAWPHWMVCQGTWGLCPYRRRTRRFAMLAASCRPLATDINPLGADQLGHTLRAQSHRGIRRTRGRHDLTEGLEGDGAIDR